MSGQHGTSPEAHRRHLALTIFLAAGLAAYLTGWLRSVYGFDVAMLLTLVGGFPIFYGALMSLLRGRLSADLAVSLAAVAALVIGQYAVAAEVVLIMAIGEALENFAVGRTRSAIAALLALRPQTARVRRAGEEREIPADEVRPDDVVLVRPGERIPVDGTVLGGHSSVDQSPITGESLPADKARGDEVFAGTINLYGALEVAVERLGADTTLEQIIHLVEDAEDARAPTQRLADRYATWFVPIVLTVAAVVWLASGEVVRAVAVLVVACPCALVLATPTAIAAGVGRLVRRGVLVKGGAVLEKLGKLKAVIFDKTGTLTLAKLRMAHVAPAPGLGADDVLALAAAVERHSEHPIGTLIAETAAGRGLALPEATHFAALPGRGAAGVVDGTTVRVGSARLMAESDVVVPEEMLARAAELSEAGCTVVLVARGTEALGALAVEDTVRHGAREAIDRLRALGVGRIVMLTGDNAAAAGAVAGELAIEDVRSGLLPADKLEAVRAIQAEAGPVAMVGDGINDAPSLVAADVGAAMAEIGTDVAIASADVVLVADRLAGLADAVETGRRVMRVIWQNILGFALAFNALAVLVASLGWISPVVGAVLHQVSSLVVCVNSLRILADLPAWRKRAGQAVRKVACRWRRGLAWASGLAAAAWLAGGLHTVGPGEVGVVRHFGRALADEGPGLHYRLPWPLGRHRVIPVERVRRVEVGFRTIPGLPPQAAAYEWSLQHRGGRAQRRAGEADVWAGDEVLVDANLVVHYRVTDAKVALFALGDALADGTSKWDALMRNLSESALKAELSCRPADEALNTARAQIEQAVLARIAKALARWNVGLAVEAVCLADVHPPVEVVPDFREVVAAMEEKEALINRALAYQKQTEALAVGESAQRIAAAGAFQYDRTLRAEGEAGRFEKVAAAFAASRDVTRLRMYLETIEQALAGRRKVIVDHAPDGRRRVLYLGGRSPLAFPPPVEPGDNSSQGRSDR